MFIFKALLLMLEGGLSFEKTENFIKVFLTAARYAMFGGGSGGATGLMHSEMFLIFAIIACGFLTITFYSELIKESVNDTLTTDKLIYALCRLFVGAMMIFFLPEILDIIFKIVEVMFGAASSIRSNLDNGNAALLKGISIEIYHNTTGKKGDTPSYLSIDLTKVGAGSTLRRIYYDTRTAVTAATADDGRIIGVTWMQNGKLPSQDFSKYWDDYYAGIHMFNDFGHWLASIVIVIISTVAICGTYFAVAKAIIEFTVFAFFSPIGIINLFGENSRIIGVRYLKKLLAKGLTLSVMVILLAISSSMCTGMIVNTLKSAKYAETHPNEDTFANGEGGTIIVDPDKADSTSLITTENKLQIVVSREYSDVDLLFQADIILKCMVMQIVQLGLLLGAAKMTDELFAT